MKTGLLFGVSVVVQVIGRLIGYRGMVKISPLLLHGPAHARKSVESKGGLREEKGRGLKVGLGLFSFFHFLSNI